MAEMQPSSSYTPTGSPHPAVTPKYAPAVESSLNAHKSGPQAWEAVNAAVSYTVRTANANFNSAKEHISYEALLASVALENEALLLEGRFLNYYSLCFYRLDGSIAERFSGGRMLLTNRRLLFLCSEKTSEVFVSMVDNPKVYPGGYNVQASVADTIFYTSFPLSAFHTLELSSKTGASAEANVRSNAPCCGCYCCCYPKTWHYTRGRSELRNRVVIKVGIKRPFIDEKQFLEIDVVPTTSVTEYRNFISEFQRVSGVGLLLTEH